MKIKIEFNDALLLKDRLYNCKLFAFYGLMISLNSKINYLDFVFYFNETEALFPSHLTTHKKRLRKLRWLKFKKF